MSNGDDVLDNWEEIDEARLNSSVQTLKPPSASCERITKKIYQNTDLATSTDTTSSTLTQMKVLQRTSAQDSTTSSSNPKLLNKSPLDDMSATFQPVMMVLHKPQDEYQSANYTGPIANQTVKILRRPTQSGEIRNNFIRPKQPIKTLQQREQEYAEARLRILGSAKNPEDDEQRNLIAAPTSVVTSITNPTQSTPTITSTSSSYNNSITNMMAGATKTNSPKTQAGANQFNNQNQQLQQQQQYQQNYQQQQQQQHNYYYNQQQQHQQQQQTQSPVYNNNRTFSINPLLALGPMGAIGQPAQYHNATLASAQTVQQHFKYQQYHQKSPQQQNKLQQQQQQQQQQTWSPVVGGSVSSTSIRQQPNDTILRLPRGPDGTVGFQVRR